MATNTWNNAAADGKWSTNGNWSSGAAPISTDDVVFNGTSTANCTIDPTSPFTVNSISLNSGYTGTITGNTSLNITIAANLTRTASSGNIVFGNGAVWNIQGSIDPNTVGTRNVDNYAGATVNLSSSNGVIGYISSTSVSPTPGIINVLSGASYTQENGEFGAIVLHNYGTLGGNAEFNINRFATASLSTQVYNHSTGVISGALNGTIIFNSNAQWLLQAGTESMSMGIINYTPAMSLTPGSYALLYFYRQNATNQTFYWTAGTYTLTAATLSAYDDTNDTGSYTVDNTAGATLNFPNLTSLALNSTGGGVTGYNPGGTMVFQKSGTTTINSNGLTLDDIVIASGNTLQLSANLACLSITVQSGGTLKMNGHNVTTTNDFTVQTGGAVTFNGGETITYGGCLYFSGTSGTPMTIEPSSGVTIAAANSDNPLCTANATYTTFENITATGITIQASNSTNVSGNSGINFSATAGTNPINSFVQRNKVTLAAGVHTIEARMSGSTITTVLDTVPSLISKTNSQNQNAALHGLYAHYDATYQQAATMGNLNMISSTQIPIAPTGLSVSTMGVATWNAVVGATGYIIYRRYPSGSGSFSTLATVGDVVAYTDPVPPGGGTVDYEVAATNANGTGPASALYTVTYSTLLNNIQAYWRMNDAADGNRLDASGNGNTLTDVNASCTQITGVITKAAGFATAVQGILDIPTNAFVNVAGFSSWTMTGWFKWTDTATVYPMVTQWAASNRCFGIQTPGSGGISMYYSTSGSNSANFSLGTTFTANTFFFLAFGYNASTGKYFISINNGTQTTHTAAAPFSGTADLTFGGTLDLPSSNSTTYCNGGACEVGLWNRVLTSGELTALYNSGAGVTYPF